MKFGIIIFVLFLSSCAYSNKNNIDISLYSAPAGAEVYINKKSYGKTPLLMKLRPSKDYNVTFRKTGYQDKTFVIKKLTLLKDLKIHRSQIEIARCGLDASGSFLVIPFITANSDKCNSFEKQRYDINMLLLDSKKKSSR